MFAASLQWFLLTPKDKNSAFGKIKLGFRGDMIQEMQLQDRLEQTTIIRFAHAAKNKMLPSRLFIFTLPAGVDVIDEIRH